MARIARIKAEGEAFYHVVSRIANKAFLLNNDEKKEVFVNMLHRAADFSGIDVITYVVMDNHFHLCVRVPKQEGEIPESEILRRVGVLYGEDRRAALEKRLAGFREEGDDTAIDAELEKLRARMGDLSEFMKTLKQRVSQWYNANYLHEGTLWSGRFKSVLVEDGRYLRNLVAYIHGNPIRAGLVTRAADYEWNAPGAAAKGDARAKKGLVSVSGGQLHLHAIVWTGNGVRTHSYKKVGDDPLRFPWTEPFYLMIDMQLGGKWVGEVDESTLPVSLHVDWVKFYEGSTNGVKFSEFIRPTAQKMQTP